MIIGLPKETKIRENRVAGTPAAVRELVQEGASVFVEKGAGVGSGFSDEEYAQAGATVLSDRKKIYEQSDLVWKVKEPTAEEIPFYRKGQLLYTFLHLAASRSLTESLCKTGITAIAYEMVETADGALPILAPMSEAAGRISAIVGANYLRKDLGGQGILLSGLQGKNRGRVTILGIGHAGQAALEMAHGLGADVMAIDLNQKKLKAIQEKYSERLVTAPPDSEVIAAAVRESDLVIGAVLVPGKRPPLLVSRKVVGTMKPGSVIIDIAVDQGGCIETIRPTTHDAPAYVEEGVIHYAVTNMPALVPRSATQALTAASLPYLKKIARLGFEKAIHEDADLKKGIAIQNGTLKIENLF